MTTKLQIVVNGDDTNRFDRKYCNEVHVPLAVEKMKAFGCSGSEVFYPVGTKSGWLVIAVYTFDSKDGVQRAFQSPDIGEVLADLPNFTDSQDVIKGFFDAF